MFQIETFNRIPVAPTRLQDTVAPRFGIIISVGLFWHAFLPTPAIVSRLNISAAFWACALCSRQSPT
jgi:hypothetical protein